MANCIELLYSSTANGIVWSGCNDDASIVVGRSTTSSTFHTLTNFTTEATIITRAGAAQLGDITCDADEKVWWCETSDFSTWQLYRANIDGSSVTNIANISGLTTSFETPSIRYDPSADRFWFASFSSTGLWTLTKAGVATKRYAATGNLGWGAIVASDGAAWARWTLGDDTTFVRRVDGTSFAQTNAAATFLSFRFSVAVVRGTGVLHYEHPNTYEYVPGVTKSAADCVLQNISNGIPFWTPDHVGSFYGYASGSPLFSQLYGVFEEEGGIPPLRVYMRDDMLDVTGPRALHPTSHQESARPLQGSYL